MKLADRKPTEFHSKVRDPRVEACIKAREREVLDLEAARGRSVMTCHRIIGNISDVHGDRPLKDNRQALDDAERCLTILRTQLKAMRRHSKTIADRDIREENGVLKP